MNDNNIIPVLISMKDTERLTSLSRTMINRLREKGNFPKSVILGERRMGFVRAEVLDWISNQIEARAAA